MSGRGYGRIGWLLGFCQLPVIIRAVETGVLDPDQENKLHFSKDKAAGGIL